MVNMTKKKLVLLVVIILTFLASCGTKKNENILREGMECGYAP